MPRAALILTLLLLVAVPSRTATIHVPGDQPTIQAGIDAAADGDTVLVAPGSYSGTGNRDIEFQGKGITVRSETGDPTTCIIDCEGSGRGFSFGQFDHEDSILEGVTVINGNRFGGGGIQIVGGDPSVRRCVVSSCFSGDGGGAYLAFSDATFEDCSFVDNSALDGGGLYLVQAYSTFTDCLILRNSAFSDGGGVYAEDYGGPTFTRCVLAENETDGTGGGVITLDSSAFFESCTITGNAAYGSGTVAGGLHAQWESYVTLQNTIVSFSTAGQAVLDAAYEPPALRCSNVYGNVGGDWTTDIAAQEGLWGNFSADPLFCDPDNGNFHIQSDSPCAPPGVTGCGLVGALPVGCGPVSVVGESWAAIKARYRE